MSTNRNLEISDPSFPEHDLIRDCAPVPELSAGFKGRVMAECTVSVASAATAWRWKVGSTTAAICALGLLICLVYPATNDSSAAVIKQAESVPSPPDSAYRLPSSPSQMAADMPKPAVQKKSTSTPGEELMEGLNRRRQKIMDANMIPLF